MIRVLQSALIFGAMILALPVPSLFRSLEASCFQGDREFVSDIAAHRTSAETESLGRVLSAEVGSVSDPGLRQRVLDTFDGKICSRDQDVLSVLIGFTAASDPTLRVEALFLLRYFDLPAAAPVVRGALFDDSPRARLTALASISYRQDAAALPAVRCVVSQDSDREVKRYAREVLRSLASGPQARF